MNKYEFELINDVINIDKNNFYEIVHQKEVHCMNSYTKIHAPNDYDL